MKNLLFIGCFLASAAIYGQSNLETEIVGTWSVVEVVQLRAYVDPSKVEEMRTAMRDIRLEFDDDHNFQLQSAVEEQNIDGTWMVKGSSVGLRSSKTQRLMTLDVQQRDGRWFFILPFAELEVRKD